MRSLTQALRFNWSIFVDAAHHAARVKRTAREVFEPIEGLNIGGRQVFMTCDTTALAVMSMSPSFVPGAAAVEIMSLGGRG